LKKAAISLNGVEYSVFTSGALVPDILSLAKRTGEERA
jgi:hypothetical protein